MSIQTWFMAACVFSTTLARASQPDDGVALASVRRLIGDAACASDQQCRTLAVGFNACGGPALYLAWSTLRTTEAALQASAAPLAQWQPGTSRGEASVCRVLADPGAHCHVNMQASAPGASSPRGTCRLRVRQGSGNAPLR